jgi:predicted phage-related endonuclease
MTTEQMNDLIARAKDTLITGEPKATKDETKQVEAADPILANELLAERQHLHDQIKELTARKSEIDDILKDAIGKNDELTVNGSTVASMTRWRQTELVKDFIEENFPIKDYPEMYKRVSRSRLDIRK